MTADHRTFTVTEDPSSLLVTVSLSLPDKFFAGSSFIKGRNLQYPRKDQRATGTFIKEHGV